MKPSRRATREPTWSRGKARFAVGASSGTICLLDDVSGLERNAFQLWEPIASSAEADDSRVISGSPWGLDCAIALSRHSEGNKTR